MSDQRSSESRGCLEQRASFHINRSEVRRKQPGCVEVKGNRATYCSDSRELYIQGDKPRRSAGMRRAVRWGKAPGTDGIFVGSRFSAFFPFPNIPDFPEFPSLPHRLPTPLTLRQVFWKPTTTFSGRDLHNKSLSHCDCKIHKHKSFCRLPVLKLPFQFCVSELFWTMSDTKNTFHETLPSNKCTQVRLKSDFAFPPHILHFYRFVDTILKNSI